MAELSRIANSEAPLRDQEQALAIRRGALRLLHALGYAAVAELPLASGRRADLVALGDGGEIWIVEIKSCIADFRADPLLHRVDFQNENLGFHEHHKHEPS
jgi:hypothetical protein